MGEKVVVVVAAVLFCMCEGPASSKVVRQETESRFLKKHSYTLINCCQLLKHDDHEALSEDTKI